MRGLILITALTLPGAAFSAPCIGAAFDTPLPGAQDVQREYADVPSARYPGLWQQGRVAGFVYKLFPDMTANLADSRDAPQWQIDVLCDAGTESCSQETKGTPDPAATAIATNLGRCLLGEDVTAADFQRATPAALDGLPEDAGVTDRDRSLSSGAALATAAGAEQASIPDATVPSAGPDSDFDAERPAATPDIAQNEPTAADTPASTSERGPSILPDATCGLSEITPGTSTVQTLQRLLQADGQDPGGDDGVLGARTRQALAAALGPEAANLQPEAAIRAMNAKMCKD
ncbi:hypothetical protein [Paracoccus sp. R86501]|uniref:hypothetical protein n=1 Tax=Paracoccus sp. R86501 TaxID=3101711 RepID=UPI003671DC7B